jgi:hypothetical protein
VTYRPSFASRQRESGIEMTIATDLDTGETRVAVTAGASTEEGKAVILKILREMGLDGVKLTITNQPEAHVHGPDKQHVLRSSRIKA